MDFAWEYIETAPQVYNYNNFEYLTSNLTGFDTRGYCISIFNSISIHEIRFGSFLLFKFLDILDYSNTLYSYYSPANDSVRTAFANYAANATIHFKGNNIVSFLFYLSP
jgi:hypothetical protein